VALIGAVIPFAATGGGFGIAAAVEAASRFANDPLSILGARSPGTRNDARLVSTKKGHGAPRTEYVLSASEPGPDEAVPMALADTADPAFLPDVAAAATPPVLLAAGLPGVPRGGGYFPFGGGTSGPGPGGGGGGGGGNGGETPEPPIPSIPEPASWAMLMLGFFTIGHIMRRERRGVGQL